MIDNKIRQQNKKMDDIIKAAEECLESIQNVFDELKSSSENRPLTNIVGDFLCGLQIQVDHMKTSASKVLGGSSEIPNDLTESNDEGNTTQEELNEILKEHVKWLNGNGGKRADFRGVNLAGVDVDFSNVNLSKADLSWGNFPWANFTGANLVGADLSRSNFSWANFTGANLVGASFNGSNLSKTNLTGADLTRVDLCGADLHGATVTNTIFTKANLTFTDFSMVDVSSAIDLCIIKKAQCHCK